MRRRSPGARILYRRVRKRASTIYKKEKLKNVILKDDDDDDQFKHLGITLKKGMDLHNFIPPAVIYLQHTHRELFSSFSARLPLQYNIIIHLHHTL